MAGPGGRARRTGVSRGQAGTIGVVLILALTLIGATVALTFGADALNRARVGSQEGGIEQAMTQLDSRSAMVGLGDSVTQRVPLAATGAGGYRVDPDAGWINVTHHNWNGSGGTETVYNESLGALIYEREDVQIAYQGGGVWRAQGGNSSMVSPPEFHYQSATLTLPVIRIEGRASASGSGVVAEITQLTRAQPVYPNLTRTYPSSSQIFANPVREGNVTVTVHSPYYQAWADYFRTRTSGEVSVDHARQTARVKLISRGISGDFEMPADGNSIELRGLSGGHPITDFELTLIDDDEDAADFSNLKWSLHAEKGSQLFELHLRDNGGGNCGGDVHATVYYSENNGADYESWTNTSAFQYECESAGNDFNDDGDTQDIRLVANFTSMTPMTYDAVQGGDGKLLFYSVSGSDTFTAPVTFDEHASEVAWESKTFNQSETTTFVNVTNHYLELMGPDVELTVEDTSGNTVNEDASFGSFEQTGSGGQFITFLHITENRVSVELD